MKSTPEIGKLLDDSHFRDAVHVAVAPVEAGEDLVPSQSVTMKDGKAVSCPDEEAIGLVDPWLKKNGINIVKKGQRFYLMIDQGTIVSLRHVWSHPAFTVKHLEAKS